MATTQAEYNESSRSEDNIYCVDGQPYSGFSKDMDGEYLIEKRFQNGVLHGVHKTFYKSGQIKIASIYTNGLENGRRIEYYECGSKKLNSNYSNGYQDGVHEEFCNQGTLQARKTFYKGKLIAIKGNV
jgi:antitoxin component YwqK of YwqJK toxin-antitoxin module